MKRANLPYDSSFLIVVWIYQASNTDEIVFYLKENRSFALCLSFFILKVKVIRN